MKAFNVLLFFCSPSVFAQPPLLQNEASVIEAAWASGQRLTNAPVGIRHMAVPVASNLLSENSVLESLATDATGMVKTQTKFWERIIITLPQTANADYMACMIVNGKCRPLPVGAVLDRKQGLLYWHVPNAYKGNFDLVFHQPGSVPGFVRVNAGVGAN
jgi:hypothetical protein